MKHTYRTLLAGVALLALGVASANAAVTLVSTTVNTPSAPAFTPIQTATFDNLTAGSPATFTMGGWTFAGNGTIQNGTSSNVYEAPSGDSTNYLAVGGMNGQGTETITSNTTYGQFGLYWGSVDAYNRLTFTLNGVGVGTFSAADLGLTPDGNGNTGTSVYANFTGNFNGISLTTSQANFEVDNLSVGGVPEPATWAMMLIGFASLAAIATYRRKSTCQSNAVTA